MDEPTLEQKMAALQERFRGQLQERYESIAHPWQDYTNKQNLAALKDIHMAAHKMAGSAATFGFVTISQLAKQIETILDVSIEEGIEPNPKNIGLINNHLEKMKTLVGES